MNANLAIPEIAQRLQEAAGGLTGYCNHLTNDSFFYQPGKKWSAAQQVRHLITATNTARLALVLPKFILRGVAGTPNRTSRSYDDLVARYKLKLSQGGRAGKRYVPAPVPASYGKEKLLRAFTKAMHRFATALQRKWSEQQPDQYIAPHPLLGKVTVRELCYFTIYHTWHHLLSIQALAAEKAR